MYNSATKDFTYFRPQSISNQNFGAAYPASANGTSYTFTPETWTCGFPRYLAASEVALKVKMNSVCSDAKAARWLLVPLLIVCAIVSVIVMWRVLVLRKQGGKNLERTDPSSLDYEGLEARKSVDPELLSKESTVRVGSDDMGTLRKRPQELEEGKDGQEVDGSPILELSSQEVRNELDATARHE
jgi:hypothetical protein